jgi:hypothetical protein
MSRYFFCSFFFFIVPIFVKMIKMIHLLWFSLKSHFLSTKLQCQTYSKLRVNSYLLSCKANPNAKSSKLVSSLIQLEFYRPQLPTQRKAQAQSQLWAIKKMISGKLRVFVIYLFILFFFALFSSKVINYLLIYKRKKTKNED